jgi:hypothetical protein
MFAVAGPHLPDQRWVALLEAESRAILQLSRVLTYKD